MTFGVGGHGEGLGLRVGGHGDDRAAVRDFIKRSIQIEYDLARQLLHNGLTITPMNQLCCNFEGQIARIVFK